VLRGAAFNGLIAFVLCLFAWGAGLSSKLRWVLPIGVLVRTFIALWNHLGERPIADPPFMEFTLLLLGGSGIYLLWEGPRLEKEKTRRRSLRTEKFVWDCLCFHLFLLSRLSWRGGPPKPCTASIEDTDLVSRPK
jgi:hypothetical protein